MKRNSRALKQRLSGRWLAALQSLAPELTDACSVPGRNVTCPFEGKPEGFRLFPDANETGGGVKQNEGPMPDGITLLMALRGWDFVTTFDELTRWLDGSSSVRPSISPQSISQWNPDQEDQRRNWLQSMWDEALPITSPLATAAKVYLRSRRLGEALGFACGLRFHPNLIYRSDARVELGRFPAILGYVRNNQGLPVAIHRTYLRATGVKLNLEGQPARKLTPSVKRATKGRVIRLAKAGDVLGVAEGIETALSVMLGTEKYLGYRVPTWACLSASMMPAFRPPEGVRHVMIFGDSDQSGAGQQAAHTLASRLQKEGLSVSVHLPELGLPQHKKSCDFADVWSREPSRFATLEPSLRCIAA